MGVANRRPVQTTMPNIIVLFAAEFFAMPIFAQTLREDATPGATPAVVELGRSLFTDARLSSTGSMTCASCQQPG